MSHFWKAEIWNDSAGTASITFGDGDDVTVSAGIGLSEEPRVVLERGMPSMAVLKVRNEYDVPTYNILHAACTRWSDGAARAVTRGMYVRVYYRDEVSAADVRAFQGRIKEYETDNDGVVTLTAYDELMILGETKDPYIVFNAVRDRMGDTTFAQGPNISCALDANNNLVATLPDPLIIQPLMKLMLAEPAALNDHTGDSVTMSTSDMTLLSGEIKGNIMVALDTDFFSIKVPFQNTHTSNTALVRGRIYDVTWTGSTYTIGTSVIIGNNVTIPADSPATLYEFIIPVKLVKNKAYLFAWEVYTSSGNLYYGYESGAPPVDIPWMASYTSSWSVYRPGTSYLTKARPMTLSYLEEREISSDDYTVVDGSTTSTLTIYYGTTTISSFSPYSYYIRVSYFYGSVAVSDVMITLAARAGFTASRAGTLAAGNVKLGYYNTQQYTYLDCLRELADLWETGTSRQWTYGLDMSGNLNDKILKIGSRYKPWVDAIGGYTFCDDPMAVEGSGVYKRIAAKSLKAAFKAKTGTVRLIGKAADGSPISCEIDDQLWAANGSLVLDTGSPMMEYVVDSAITSGAMAVQIAEAYIREQKQNSVEGSITLDGQWPNLWNRTTTNNYFGQGLVEGLTIPSHGLSAAKVLPRKVEISGGRTVLELDNERINDVSMLKRSMDKSLRSESFDVSSLPETVYIYVRYTGTLPAGYASFDRIRISRADGVYYYTNLVGTKVVRSDDYCSPTAGAGYSHFQGFFPANVHGMSSYKYSGSTPYVYKFYHVAVGDGTTWVDVTTDGYYIWSHQNVLVDFRGLRP